MTTATDFAHTTRTRLLARAVGKGANPTEAAALLENLRTTSGNADNLAHSLMYCGYATETGAHKAAAEVFPA